MTKRVKAAVGAPLLRTHGRYAYSAIKHRPVYDWPNGMRLAVYIGLNLEHFAFGEGLGAELCPAGPQPDRWRPGSRSGAQSPNEW